MRKQSKTVWNVRDSRKALAGLAARKHRERIRLQKEEPYKNPSVLRSFLSKMGSFQAENYGLVEGFGIITSIRAQQICGTVGNPKLFDEHFKRFLKKEEPMVAILNDALKHAGHDEFTVGELKAYFYKTALNFAKEDLRKRHLL